jgi:hypothetical protein
MKTNLNNRRPLEARPRKRCKPGNASVASSRDTLLRKTILAELRPGLERDTQLMPWLIAETVCDEVSQFLGVYLPARYAEWLEAKAELCYSGRRRFYKLMRGRGNAPRDWLYAFMRHWLGSILHLERPDFSCCLPMSFARGKRLAHGTRPRTNRFGCNPDFLPASRDWDPSRVTRHHRWAWLARIGTPEVSERRRRTDRDVFGETPNTASGTPALPGIAVNRAGPPKKSRTPKN